MTYYRIQAADRDVTALLDTEQQVSISYVDDTVRAGVSVCDSVEELATYLAQSGMPWDETYVLVEVEATWSVDTDEDAHLGARLVHPTTIVSVAPLTDDFHDLVGAAFDAIAA